MRIRVPVLLLLAACVTSAACTFDCGIIRVVTTYPAGYGLNLPDTNVPVSGSAGASCQGNGFNNAFDGVTDSNGVFTDPLVCSPAVWNVFKGQSPNSPFCPPDVQFGVLVNNGGTVYFRCSGFTPLVFSISPVSVDALAPPASFTVAGSQFVTTNGMPTIDYYDEAGNFRQRVTASAVSADGVNVTFPAPDVAGMYSGRYAAVIRNVAGDGTLLIAGASAFEIYNNDPPPPPPPPDGGGGGGCEGQICIEQ